MGEAREEAVPLLPLSGGPTQAGTTPRVAFRAAITADDELEMGVGDLGVHQTDLTDA
jgi:hypothetical protein